MLRVFGGNPEGVHDASLRGLPESERAEFQRGWDEAAQEEEEG
jgi:hypothetical protein